METKVVAFPKGKAARAPKTDSDLVADVRRAWRKLDRAIIAAQAAGLTVETDFRGYELPRFTRSL